MLFFYVPISCDIVVVGGGHAGVEASYSASKLGADVVLLTHSRGSIARQSCNPAVGGTAKSQVVREVDSLGGIMGIAADLSAIQYRVLNRSKGLAVQSTRAQTDRTLYERTVQKILSQTNVQIVEGDAKELLVEGNKVVGVRTERDEISAKCVVLATGTFLGGKIFVGHDVIPGGRFGEKQSDELTESLRQLGLELLRFKTGTPPRILASSVNFDRMIRQDGEKNYIPFSIFSPRRDFNQRPCYITHTNERTHRIIRDNLARSAMYGGLIKGIGPRYCPSIEVKVVQFPNYDRHIVFIEPEGADSEELYPNGLSNSLPTEVQVEMLRTIEGLEDVEITRPGYAIEYDVVSPLEVSPSLECRKIEGLFLAGQIMGTSGYEEAAGLGIMAGINSALKLLGYPPLIFRRDQTYIGVMINDLVFRGTDEPYRLLTGRAEYRLMLREDNRYIAVFSSVPREVLKKLLGGKFEIVEEMVSLHNSLLGKIAQKHLSKIEAEMVGTKPGISLAELIRQGDADIEKLAHILQDIWMQSPEGARMSAIAEIRYEGYIEHQRKQAERIAEYWDTPIPPLDFAKFNIRREAKEKFCRFKPKTFGEAMSIPGITLADIFALIQNARLFHMKH